MVLIKLISHWKNTKIEDYRKNKSCLSEVASNPNNPMRGKENAHQAYNTLCIFWIINCDPCDLQHANSVSVLLDHRRPVHFLLIILMVFCHSGFCPFQNTVFKVILINILDVIHIHFLHKKRQQCCQDLALRLPLPQKF